MVSQETACSSSIQEQCQHQAGSAKCTLCFNVGKTYTQTQHNPGAGGWVEDTKWTAQMNDGWDPAQAQAVMDGLQTTFGTSK